MVAHTTTSETSKTVHSSIKSWFTITIDVSLSDVVNPASDGIDHVAVTKQIQAGHGASEACYDFFTHVLDLHHSLSLFLPASGISSVPCVSWWQSLLSSVLFTLHK